jgi:hypothetical protein
MTPRPRRVSIIVVLLLVISGPALAQPLDIWRHLLHTESLAEPLDAEAVHFSSWARNGGNSDLGWYYGVDSHGWKIICDMDGPGVLTDFWWHKFPADPAWRWRIYVDNLTTALIDTSILQLCGHVPPFTFPVADSSSNGFFSYVPIPFQSHLRITFSGQSSIYYHVTAHRYPAGTIVEPFTFPPTDDYLVRLDSLRARMLSPADPIFLDNPTDNFGGQLTLGAGQSHSWTFDGSGMTRRILLRLPTHPQSVLESFWVRIYADAYPFPDLDGPASELFGQPLGWHAYASLLTGTRGDTMYLNLPVFFDSHLRLEMTNGTSSGLSAGLWAEVIARDPTGIPPFRARAQYHEQNPTIEWELYEYANFTGAGNYVGSLFDTQQDDPHVLEGDEMFWFNSQSIPAWHGTGTEDYFKGGRYWYPAYAQLPEHGCIVYLGDSAAAYHWHLNDALPFTSSLRGATEVGRFGQMTGHYRTMAFAYVQPEAWHILDADGSHSSSPNEAIRIVGRGLVPGSVATDVAMGSSPAPVIGGSAQVNPDSLLDFTVAAPESLPSGTYSISLVLEEDPIVICPDWRHEAHPYFTFTPLRDDLDTCVFTTDTIEVAGHGFPIGAIVNLVAASIALPWTTPAPTVDSLGRLHGFCTIPELLPAGDLTLSALIDGETVAIPEHLLKNRDFYRLELETMNQVSGLRFREECVWDYAASNNTDPWGRDCVRMLQGTGIGSYSVLNFYYPASGICHLDYFWVVCPAGAKMRTTIDTLTNLSEFNSYASIPSGRWVRSDTVSSEPFYLSAGWHTFRVEIVGRDSLAHDWQGILDQILFVTHSEPVSPPTFPDRIRDLTIIAHDSLMELHWSRVTSDSLGNPLEPDGYDIYTTSTLDSDFVFLGSVPASDSVYVDSQSLLDESPSMRFYRVVAVLEEQGGAQRRMSPHERNAPGIQLSKRKPAAAVRPK